MSRKPEFNERVVRLAPPSRHHSLLVAEDGRMLGHDENGHAELIDDGDDRVIWSRQSDGLKHVLSGRVIQVAFDDVSVTLPVAGQQVVFAISHGPEKLPSEYLQTLREDGFVCLNSIIASEVVEGLRRVACVGPYEDLEPATGIPKICQDVAVGRALVEPVSLWVLRQYLGHHDVHLGHPPGMAVVVPNILAQAGRGWHMDQPYTRSNSGQIFDRSGPPRACNRNFSVSAFTHVNGATAFVAGSHKGDFHPPKEWNAPLLEDPPGMPYSGPEATVYEVPSGSIALYDSRTWHRAGFNRSEHKRAAMLSSGQVPGVIPKTDPIHSYNRLTQTPVFTELNDREQREVRALMVMQPGAA